jgi:hypothetical protein
LLEVFASGVTPDVQCRTRPQVCKENWDELLAGVADSCQELIVFFGAIPAEEFDRDRGLRFRGYKVTIARLIARGRCQRRDDPCRASRGL